jgi:hypothetical protein
MFVKTAVSELDFDTVKVGGNITVTSNETMESYQAVIKEVSEFPVDSATAGVYGNPNSSFYPIKAYIEDAGDLRIGSRLRLPMIPSPWELPQRVPSICLWLMCGQKENRVTYTRQTARTDLEERISRQAGLSRAQ